MAHQGMTTDTINTDTIATGGFNTGRLYTAAGQRIWWAQRADGWVYFKDIDRMIDGWLHRSDPVPGGGTGLRTGGSPGFARWLMRGYDNHEHRFSHPGQTERNPSAPADFDLGAALRI